MPPLWGFEGIKRLISDFYERFAPLGLFRALILGLNQKR
jgi:hypothetical protein